MYTYTRHNIINKHSPTKKNTYPRNAKSFAALAASPTGVSAGVWSRSSVGKYDVSVIERRCGTKGASMCRIDSQSTP